MSTDLAYFIKRFILPENFHAPAELIYRDIIARPLTRDDIDADLTGVNSSIAIIQKTRGGSWPQGKLSKDEDLLDLAWHEKEFRDNSSFAYVMYSDEGAYIGCFYLYPMGVRTKLNESNLTYDVDASWWVTTDAYAQGYYQIVANATVHWLHNNFPFKEIYYSNIEQ